MPLFLDWHIHKYLRCAPDSHAITLSGSLIPSPALCWPTRAASSMPQNASKAFWQPQNRNINGSLICVLFFSQSLSHHTTCVLSSHLSYSRVLRLIFLTGFAKIFLSGHATYCEYVNPMTKAILRGSPDMHYPAAAEWLLPLDLQLLGRPEELLLFLTDKAWEQRGGPAWETQRSAAL